MPKSKNPSDYGGLDEQGGGERSFPAKVERRLAVPSKPSDGVKAPLLGKEAVAPDWTRHWTLVVPRGGYPVPLHFLVELDPVDAEQVRRA